jgi:single-strand DNA-binding protein
VEGQLKQDRWEQDGMKRSKVVVEASNIQLLGGRSDRQSEYQGQSQQQGAPASRNSQPFESYNPGPSQSDSGPAERFEDDIPF